MAATRSPSRDPLSNWRPALKSVPSLQLPHHVLVGYLSNGYGYDSESTGALVKEGNRLFEQRQLEKAIEVYGVAYELGRLHYVYPPLMHDLLLRRALCLSMLGDFKRALFEAELALQIVPHSATTYLVCGILYSKLQRTDAANRVFHRAVEQCRLLRDFIECIVAMVAQARGHCDHAIEICTEVLKRSPSYPMALLARGVAYRYHASGYFEKQAEADSMALCDVDAKAGSFMTCRFTLEENHVQIEEMLLYFHPWLSAQGPRPYEDYPVYPKRQAFLTTCLVLNAVAKLRTLVRSSRLVRSVCEKHDELLQQRASAERRMQELVEAQRNFAHLEQHTEVWGPADPDHAIVRKYRRYWMERPVDFPRREAGGAHSRPLAVESSAAVSGQPEAHAVGPSSPPSRGPAPVAAALSQPASQSQAVSTRSAATPAHAPPRGGSSMPASPATQGLSAAPVAPTPPAASLARPTPPVQWAGAFAVTANSAGASGRAPPVPAPPSGGLAAAALAAASPPLAPAPSVGLAQPWPLGPSPFPSMASGLPSHRQPVPPGRPLQSSPPERPSAPWAYGIPAPPAAFITALPAPYGGARPLQMAHRDASAAGSPQAQGGGRPVAPSSPQYTGMPEKLPERTGADWTQEQWFLKALEIAEAFVEGEDVSDLGKPPSCQAPEPLPEHKYRPKQSPPPASRIVRVVDGVEEGLIAAVEQEGFDIIPDWYGALDRIYALTDMAQCKEKPEPFVGDGSRAGVPGCSFLIKSSNQKSCVFSPAEEETRAKAHEALMARYQNRLLVTSLR